MKYRTIAVAVIYNNKGKVLICKKPEGRGVFPGQWALPGGGIEENEKMEEALRREVWEEVGLKIKEIIPLYFRDDVQPKYYPDGKVEEIYMIYLLFTCKAVGEEVRLNREFEKYAWVGAEDLGGFDLNKATKMTLKKIGFL